MACCMPFSLKVVTVVNISLGDNAIRVQNRLLYNNMGLIILRLGKCMLCCVMCGRGGIKPPWGGFITLRGVVLPLQGGGGGFITPKRVIKPLEVVLRVVLSPG